LKQCDTPTGQGREVQLVKQATNRDPTGGPLEPLTDTTSCGQGQDVKLVKLPKTPRRGDPWPSPTGSSSRGVSIFIPAPDGSSSGSDRCDSGDSSGTPGRFFLRASPRVKARYRAPGLRSSPLPSPRLSSSPMDPSPIRFPSVVSPKQGSPQQTPDQERDQARDPARDWVCLPVVPGSITAKSDTGVEASRHEESPRLVGVEPEDTSWSVLKRAGAGCSPSYRGINS